MRALILSISFFILTSANSWAQLPENETFPNGDPKVSWEQGQDQSIIRKEYFFSGQLKSEGQYQDDKLNGLYKEYSEDGQPYLEINFKDGIENGPYKEYFQSGPLAKEANFENGQFEGLYKEYYEDGTPFKEFNFAHGKRQGEGKIYHPNGELQAKLNFKDDQTQGNYQEFDENGELVANEVLSQSSLASFENNPISSAQDSSLKPQKTSAWMGAFNDLKAHVGKNINQNRSPVYYFILFAFSLLALTAVSYFFAMGHKGEAKLFPHKQAPVVAGVRSKEFNFMHEESVVMYRRLLETVASGIFVADLKGNLIYANFALMKLLGLKARTDIFGFNINDQFIDTLSSHERFIDELKKGEIAHYTFKFKSTPNDMLILSASANYIYSDKGEPLGIQGVVYNVTEKAKLEEDLVVEKRKMDLMLELFERIDGIKDLDELVDYVVRGVTDIFGANRCSIMLVDKDRMLVVKGAFGLSKEAMSETKIKLGESICGVVAKKGEAVVVKNIEYDKRFARGKAAQYLGRSFMIAPLEYDDQIIGVINVSEKKAEISSSVPFDDIDLRVLQLIATKVGSAIKNVELYTELNLLTHTDPITKIYNYRLLSESLEREMKRFKREKNNLCIFMMDLDSFKSYNDSFGHLEGDELLRNMGMILKNSMRETDIVCRYAGDEFCAILPNTNLDGVKAVAEKVIKAVGEFPFMRKVTISIGAAMYQEGMSKKDILSKADKALYHAKHSGKNQVVVSS
jgi:diguanylate cyclase (GGDEF)-like protein/PAS domain S-box-containing protein